MTDVIPTAAEVAAMRDLAELGFGEDKDVLRLCDTADALRVVAKELYDALEPCHAILRHKEICPPMNPGVQDAMEIRVGNALANARAALAR